MDGLPVRPGVAEPGAILLPLAKGRAGEDGPTVVVKVVYLQQTPAWQDDGRAAIALPAVDLPTSRTGLRLFRRRRARAGERVVGVLPIRVDVPRAGSSYRFSRPLVVDDETRVAFQYKRK